MVSEGRVIISSASRPAFGSTYQVKVCKVGAQVASASSGTTVNVQPGHGFIANDRFIVGVGEGNADGYRSYRVVSSVTATTLELESAVSVAANEYLCNLGRDSGGGFPLYDHESVAVYSDMGYTNQYSGSLVAADSTGRFRYHHLGVPRWHLILTSTQTPIALDIDTGDLAEEDPVSYQVRYAHLFADGGTGTATDPWTTTGSNPIQAAYDDFTGQGAKIIRCISGVYDLGSSDGAVTIAPSTENLEGLTIEGYGMGTTQSDSYDGGTIFTYSGTGSAFKIGDFETTNYTCGFFTLRKFKVLQTGTDGTGIGFLLRNFRRSLIEDVLVEDFSYGFALATVSDFNTFRRVHTRDCQAYHVYVGYTTGMNTPNGQCNGNIFQECDIMNLSRDNGYANFGIYVEQDSVANVVRDSRFHNFDTTDSIAVSCHDSNDFSVHDNYFEGNYYAVGFLNHDTTDLFGFRCTGNYITQTEKIAVYINCGSSGLIQGAVVGGNHITNPSTSSPYDAVTGILLHDGLRNAVVYGNEYVSMATADVTVGGANTTYSRFDDGAVTCTGTITSGAGGIFTGSVNAAGLLTSSYLRLADSDLNVTGNDAVVTAGKGFINITNVSGTNTITLNAPSSVNGQILVLRCAALTAGTVTLDDSGNCALSAAWVPDANDTLTLIAKGSVWVELTRAAN